MKRFTSLLVCVAALLLCITASATEPSRVRYKLPVVETNTAGEKCLNTTEWAQVLTIASEYKGLFEWRLTIEPTLWKYKSLEESYELKLSILEQQIKVLEDDRGYLQLRLEQEQKVRTGHLGKYKIEKGVMWAVIAIETVVIGIMGIRGAI